MKTCVLALTLIATPCLAEGDLPVLDATRGEPREQCAAVDKALPRSLAALRRQAPVLSQRISDQAGEYCDMEKYRCRVVDIKMPGLEAYLLEVLDQRVLSTLAIEISAPRWRLMKGVRVGEPVTALAARYGATVPPALPEFKICGQRGCLEVGQRNGRVTRLRIDCQADI